MEGSDIDALVQAIAKGDRGAFKKLYEAMERPLFRFIQLKLNDPFRSADILHEVFLEVWRGASRFQNRSSARTWMFSIAYRKVVDEIRKQGRLSYGDEMPEQADDSPSVEACLVTAERAEAVRACLDALSPEHRLAIELSFFEDMSYRDISLVTDVPEGTVKSRVFHAKQLLLRCLSTAGTV